MSSNQQSRTGARRVPFDQRLERPVNGEERRPGITFFTLTELLLVIGIIALLAGMLTVGAYQVRQRARRDNTRVLIERIQTALAQYQAESGDYSGFITQDADGLGTDYETVAEILRDRDAVEALEIQNGVVVDSWDRPIRIRRAGRNHPGLDIWSTGPDPEESDDDVVNWTRDWRRSE